MYRNLFEGDAKPKVRREPDGKNLIRDKILGCTNCELHAVAKGPVPFRGPFPSKVALIGEAPGREEDSKGGPFLGPAGLLLQAELRANKVVPDRLFWMNVVSCFPKGKNTTPKQSHIRACRSNCWDQVNLCNPSWVVIVGAVALHALAPWPYWHGVEKKITEMRQYPYAYRGRYWVPVIHPAAALRTDKYMAMFRKDIYNLVSQIRSGYPTWSEDCYRCGLPVYVYDSFGIPWCSGCDPKLEVE